jgi:hypothetical protein
MVAICVQNAARFEMRQVDGVLRAAGLARSGVSKIVLMLSEERPMKPM